MLVMLRLFADLSNGLFDSRRFQQKAPKNSNAPRAAA
jgi:hypothetical protein